MTQPPGYSSQCKACNSALRPEIDQRLLAGESTRSVSTWLETTHGEKIPFQNLAKHKLSHCAVRAAALAKIEAVRPVHEAAIEKIVAEASLLDEVAGMAIRGARAIAPTVGPEIPAGAAIAFGKCLAEARAAVMAKHELLHGKQANLTLTGLGDLLSLGFDTGTEADSAAAPEEVDT